MTWPLVLAQQLVTASLLTAGSGTTPLTALRFLKMVATRPPTFLADFKPRVAADTFPLAVARSLRRSFGLHGVPVRVLPISRARQARPGAAAKVPSQGPSTKARPQASQAATRETSTRTGARSQRQSGLGGSRSRSSHAKQAKRESVAAGRWRSIGARPPRRRSLPPALAI